jgi:spore germination protein KC
LGSKGILFLLGKNSTQIWAVTIPGCKDVSLLIETEKTKIRGEFINDQPTIFVSIWTKGYIRATSCNVTSSAFKKMIEEKMESEIKNTVLKTIKRVLYKDKTDIFGFGWALERSDGDRFQKIKTGNWIPQIKLNVQVKNRIDGTGQIFNPIEGEE